MVKQNIQAKEVYCKLRAPAPRQKKIEPMASAEARIVPKYLNNAVINLFQLHEHIEAAIEGKSSHERFWKNSSRRREMCLQVK